jgi:ribosomal protein S25
MAKKTGPEEKAKTLEEHVAQRIREGRFRAPIRELTLEELQNLPRMNIDPEVAAEILRDLIENR